MVREKTQNEQKSKTTQRRQTTMRAIASARKKKNILNTYNFILDSVHWYMRHNNNISSEQPERSENITNKQTKQQQQA